MGERSFPSSPLLLFSLHLSKILFCPFKLNEICQGIQKLNHGLSCHLPSSRSIHIILVEKNRDAHPQIWFFTGIETRSENEAASQKASFLFHSGSGFSNGSTKNLSIKSWKIIQDLVIHLGGLSNLQTNSVKIRFTFANGRILHPIQPDHSQFRGNHHKLVLSIRNYFLNRQENLTSLLLRRSSAGQYFSPPNFFVIC